MELLRKEKSVCVWFLQKRNPVYKSDPYVSEMLFICGLPSQKFGTSNLLEMNSEIGLILFKEPTVIFLSSGEIQKFSSWMIQEIKKLCR